MTEKIRHLSFADIEHICALRNPQINRQYEIPYVAGYSKDGKTIYIDNRLPQHFPNGLKVAPFLCVHEIMEKYYEDIFKLTYQEAHKAAIQAEKTMVTEFMDWNYYNNWWKHEITALKEFHGPLPSDLDIKPEKDCHDTNTLHHIRRILH